MDRALQRSSCYRLDLSTINNQSMQTPELALDACLPLYAWLSELASAFADMISLRYVCVCASVRWIVSCGTSQHATPHFSCSVFYKRKCILTVPPVCVSSKDGWEKRRQKSNNNKAALLCCRMVLHSLCSCKESFACQPDPWNYHW